MNNKTIRILLVDEHLQDEQLIREALQKQSFIDFQLERETSADDAYLRMESDRFHVILLDYQMCDCEGQKALPWLRQNSPHTPIVVLAEKKDEEAALATIGDDAQDYLLKDQLDSVAVPRAIQYAIQRHQMQYELSLASNQLQYKNRRLAELYETAQRFVDNVSHELRTPLTIIREFTSIVLDGNDGPTNASQRHRLGVILNRTDDLSMMIDDLLDISRLEAGLLNTWRRSHSVAEHLEQTAKSLQRRAELKRISLTVDCDADLPPIYCDEEKMRRAIINLVSNAIKFTPEGGQVQLAASRKDHHYVEISVLDNGPGISQAHLRKIFQRFRQAGSNPTATAGKGCGLGLNIAQELVRLNLGSMEVASQVGEGSAFSFSVPVANPDTLIECFLEHYHSGSSFVTAVTVNIDQDEGHRSSAIVDEFLHRSLRNHDFVFPSHADEWIILVACSEQDVQGLLNRMTTEWSRFQSHFSAGELSDLRLQIQGSWHVRQQQDELIDWFSAVTATTPSAPGQQGRVLIIDDEREIALALGLRLEAAGFNVVSAHDGRSGIEAARNEKPDAVLLDVGMPTMDGLEVLKSLKSDPRTNATPVIMLSTSLTDQQEAMEQGAQFFIQKPYQAQSVVEGIRKVLVT